MLGEGEEMSVEVLVSFFLDCLGYVVGLRVVPVASARGELGGYDVLIDVMEAVMAKEHEMS